MVPGRGTETAQLGGKFPTRDGLRHDSRCFGDTVFLFRSSWMKRKGGRNKHNEEPSQLYTQLSYSLLQHQGLPERPEPGTSSRNDEFLVGTSSGRARRERRPRPAHQIQETFLSALQARGDPGILVPSRSVRSTTHPCTQQSKQHVRPGRLADPTKMPSALYRTKRLTCSRVSNFVQTTPRRGPRGLARGEIKPNLAFWNGYTRRHALLTAGSPMLRICHFGRTLPSIIQAGILVKPHLRFADKTVLEYEC